MNFLLNVSYIKPLSYTNNYILLTVVYSKYYNDTHINNFNDHKQSTRTCASFNIDTFSVQLLYLQNNEVRKLNYLETARPLCKQDYVFF